MTHSFYMEVIQREQLPNTIDRMFDNYGNGICLLLTKERLHGYIINSKKIRLILRNSDTIIIYEIGEEYFQKLTINVYTGFLMHGFKMLFDCLDSLISYNKKQNVCDIKIKTTDNSIGLYTTNYDHIQYVRANNVVYIVDKLESNVKCNNYPIVNEHSDVIFT